MRYVIINTSSGEEGAFMEKIVISNGDVFGMYTSNDAQMDIELQMCNCCQSCQAGKC